MNKTAILLFGAFNPITYAHVTMAEILQHNYKDADIWYIPANSTYIQNKMGDKAFLTDDERLITIRQIVADLGCHVSDIEMKGIVDGKAYNTVQYFKNTLGYDKVYICLGSDNLITLHRWYKADDLTRENEFIIFERNGVLTIPNVKEFHYHFNKGLPLGRYWMSSTDAREYYEDKNWEELKKTVPPAVYSLLLEKSKKEK